MAEMSKKRCVIVAAGSIDDTSAIKHMPIVPILLSLPMRDMFIAAMPVLSRIWFVGDYDSSKKPKTQNELIALNPIKDATDTETALTEAEKGDTRKLLFWVRSAAELTIPWLT